MIPIRRVPGSGFRELLSYESCQFIFHHDDHDDHDDAIPPPQSKAEFTFGFYTTHRPILYIHANPCQALLYKGRTRMNGGYL